MLAHLGAKGGTVELLQKNRQYKSGTVVNHLTSLKKFLNWSKSLHGKDIRKKWCTQEELEEIIVEVALLHQEEKRRDNGKASKRGI